MSFAGAKSNHPLLILLGLMAASLLGLLLVPAIPQDQAYHQFADQRTLLGIPNFWNVVSNIPFVVVGRRAHAISREPGDDHPISGIFSDWDRLILLPLGSR
jgi:hypothetical protein